MSKKKYYIFSSEKLSFEEAYKNKWQKFIKKSPLLITGFILCLIVVYSLSFFILTPNEKKIKYKNELLQKEFKRLASKVDIFEKTIKTLSLKDDSLYRLMLGMPTLPLSIKKAGIGGSQKKISITNYNELVSSITQKLNNLNSKVTILDNSFHNIIQTAKKNKDKIFHIPAIMPIYNKDLKRTGAGFGIRFHPILKIKRMHEGIDFYASKGTNIYATADGTVKSVRFSTTFGNLIIIDHSYGIETYYAHLSKFNVTKGEKVKRGQVIGFVGNTGLSSGPHLHYEIHIKGKEVDPINYFFNDLTPEQYSEIIKLSNKEIYSMD